ncbi:MAG TPA: hypothetical protein VGE09_03370 [Pseudoxanthomonas sp.]
MSRTPASYAMTVQRGSTWEDEFTYTDDDGTPIDLTGYEARMQVRTLATQYGTSTDGLMLELSTTGTDPLLVWDTAVTGRLRIVARPDQHAALNAGNARKAKYAYAIELFKPDGTGEYVLPLVTGRVTVRGEVVR